MAWKSFDFSYLEMLPFIPLNDISSFSQATPQSHV